MKTLLLILTLSVSTLAHTLTINIIPMDKYSYSLSPEVLVIDTKNGRTLKALRLGNTFLVDVKKDGYYAVVPHLLSRPTRTVHFFPTSDAFWVNQDIVVDFELRTGAFDCVRWPCL